ncbi:MAG: UdgX family uracil-DNA binding protein [Acidimicrobiales bacterium]
MSDSLDQVRITAAECRACDLWKSGTQTVFGEGSAAAELMLVGEQPGDKEDLAGRPFVGPAGRILDQGLEEAGIDRSTVYVTNAVKHFKWEARGKRRLHQRPLAAEISACRPWLDREIELVEPSVVVCPGRNRGPGHARTVVQGDQTAGRAVPPGGRARGHSHRPPLVHSPGARPRSPEVRDGCVRRGSTTGRHQAER